MDCRRSLASCVTLSLLAGCGVPSEGLRGADGEVDASADVSSPDAPAPADVASLADGACVSTRAYFEARAWPEVFVRCATCHVPGGEAGTTRVATTGM